MWVIRRFIVVFTDTCYETDWTEAFRKQHAVDDSKQFSFLPQKYNLNPTKISPTRKSGALHRLRKLKRYV